MVPFKAMDATTVRKAFEKVFKAVPRQMKRSMTYDNGSEMSQYKLLQNRQKYKSTSHTIQPQGKANQ